MATDVGIACESCGEKEKYTGCGRGKHVSLFFPNGKKTPLDYEFFKECIESLKLILHILLPGLSLGHP